jgi:hypothetical protein
MLLAAAAREIAHVEDADPSRRAGQSTIRGSRAPFAIGQKAIPSSHPRSAVASELRRRRSIHARVGRAHGGLARRKSAHGTRVEGACVRCLLDGTQPASIEPAARAPTENPNQNRFSHRSTSPAWNDRARLYLLPLQGASQDGLRHTEGRARSFQTEEELVYRKESLPHVLDQRKDQISEPRLNTSARSSTNVPT